MPNIDSSSAVAPYVDGLPKGGGTMNVPSVHGVLNVLRGDKNSSEVHPDSCEI